MAPASTPPSGIRKGIPILRLKRYTYLRYFLLAFAINLQTSMHNASRYPFSLSCTRERVPKGQQAPESICWKNLHRDTNRPSLGDIIVPTGAASNPTSPSATDLRRDAIHQSPRLDPIGHQEASPLSPKSFGLRAHGGPQPGQGSSVPRPEKQP
jgi:hypothetical protein